MHDVVAVPPETYQCWSITGVRYLRTSSQPRSLQSTPPLREWRSCVLHVILEDADQPKSVPEHLVEAPRKRRVLDDRGKMAGKPSEELECSFLRHLKADAFELVDYCIGQRFELLSLNA